MNKADGFGWQSSPKKSNFENGDNDSATDSRQELSFWGGLADALRRTANYASSEFERFFGNMGFRSEPYTSHREPLRPTSPEQRVDVGFAESSSLASSLVPNHHRPTKDHSGGGKLWRQSPRSSLFAKRDPRRRSHSGRLREIQQLSKMLNTLKDEAEQAERDIRAQSFSRSQTSFETADTFSEESANLKPARIDAQDASSQSLHMPTPLIHENNMQTDDSAASVKHKNLDEGHDERVARLEKQIMHLQKEVAAYRESIKSLTSSAKAAAESVAKSPVRSRPPLPPSFDTSHIRASATPRESPLPSPPAISPNRVSLPNRSPRPNRITKPTASPIRAHNLQGTVRVLPPSSFVRDAYRSQTNRAAPDDKHIGAMRAIVRQIPHVKLRRTEHVPGPDGSLHTNPFWIEIYDPDRNYRQKRSRYRNTEETDSMTEQESPVKRQKTTWY